MCWKVIHERLLHTRAPVNFGPLNVIFPDNRNHFLHHSVHPDYYNCNFAGYFTVWDRVFGTYRRPHPSVLSPTGLMDKFPPQTPKEFFSARLRERPSLEQRLPLVRGFGITPACPFLFCSLIAETCSEHCLSRSKGHSWDCNRVATLPHCDALQMVRVERAGSPATPVGMSIRRP